jgi:hypothetical protein
MLMQNSQVPSKKFSNWWIIFLLDIRRLSACLICELVYNNESAQAKMGEICEDFTPVGGAVAINSRIPRNIIYNDNDMHGN